MDSSTTILFAGGGTGGHLYPGIAVAAELRRRDQTVCPVFVGSTRPLESGILAQHHLEHRTLPVESLTTLKRNPFKFAIRNCQAVLNARSLIRELKPQAVIGLGGYASAPLVWAARKHHVPIVLLEQNVIPGRTTRWLSRFADRICTSFDETKLRLRYPDRVVLTGNPVRSEIAALYARNVEPQQVRREILVLGGSQGADSLNDAVVTAMGQIRELLTGWTVVHQSGPRQTEQIRSAYRDHGISATVESFFHDLPQKYATAKIAISRAGATTLSELACAGIPMILLPYPFAADDHQKANARVFVEHQCATMVEHSGGPETTATELTTALRRLLTDETLRQTSSERAKLLAHPLAPQRIADVIGEILKARQ